MSQTTKIPKATLKAERRKYPRLKKRSHILAGKVTYPIDEENFATGISENISLGGVMLDSGKAFEEGSLMQVKITLPGWHKYHPGFIRVLEDSIGSPMTAICEVMRCEQSGQGYAIAARFINIDPDDFIAFQDYLEKNPGRK